MRCIFKCYYHVSVLSDPTMTLFQAPPAGFFLFFFFFSLTAPVPGQWKQQWKIKKERKKNENSSFGVSFLVFHGFSPLAHDCSCHSKAARRALNNLTFFCRSFSYILPGTIMCWIASSASQLFPHRTASWTYEHTTITPLPIEPLQPSRQYAGPSNPQPD